MSYATSSKSGVIKGTTDEEIMFKFGMPRPRKLLKAFKEVGNQESQKRFFKIA